MLTNQEESYYELLLEDIQAATEREHEEARNYESVVRVRALLAEEDKLLHGLCTQAHHIIDERNGMGHLTGTFLLQNFDYRRHSTSARLSAFQNSSQQC